MKDSGIGTPATRAAIIERLIDVGYVERDGRALVPTEKGMNVIRLLGDHKLTSPELTGEWEHRLAQIEDGSETRKKFMDDIAKFAGATVGELDAKLKDVRIPRANLGPCPVCGHDIVENRKGYSCWSREDPGCGFVIWKSKAGKQMPAAVVRELVQTGRTARQVTGFKGRSGRSFRAKLALMQNEEGKWRVEFDEPWAKEGEKAPAVDDAEAAAAAAAAGNGAPAAASVPASASGGFAPSRAQGSSNSTRHLPSSPCTSARRARNERPVRPLKPVTGFAVRPVWMSSRATAAGSCLPALPFQITNPQPGSSRDQHE